jgi:hypothetical protein
MNNFAKAIARGAMVFLAWIAGAVAILSVAIVTTPKVPDMLRQTSVGDFGDHVIIQGMWLVNDALPPRARGHARHHRAAKVRSFDSA